MDSLNYRSGKNVKYMVDDPIWLLHEFDIDYNANTLFLYGREEYIAGAGEAIEEPGIDYTIANRFLRNLHIMSNKPGTDPILVRMKTCGGIWEEGMAIHNAISTCPKPVIILSETHARSMSSLILMAADKKILMPDSTFMFHDGTLDVGGTIKQVRSYAAETEKAGTRMLDIYVNRLAEVGKFANKGWSKSKIRNMLKTEMQKKEDVYLSATEAVEWGFADAVFDADWKKLVELP